RQKARPCGAGPRDFRSFGISDGNRANRAGSGESRAAHFARLVVRFQWAGNIAWTAHNVNDDFALHVETRKIVVIRFGNREPVTDEDRFSLDAFSCAWRDSQNR